MKTDPFMYINILYYTIRDGCETFFDILESNGIPLLIFSAGIAGECKIS